MSCNFAEFISSNSVFMESLGFSTSKIVSSANRDNFTSAFSIWMPFISFSCSIAVARASSSMVNKSGKNEHPCLVTDLTGQAFSFSSLSMILAINFS